MVFGDGGSFRTRAASLLSNPFANHVQNSEAGSPQEDQLPNPPLSKEKDAETELHANTSLGHISNEKQTRPSPGRHIAQVATGHKPVRVVPAWVTALDEDDEEYEESEPDTTSHLLPIPPPEAQVAQHNNSPSTKGLRLDKRLSGVEGLRQKRDQFWEERQKPVQGRQWDQDREWATPITSNHFSEHSGRWRAFAEASALPPLPPDNEERVTEQWLLEHGPDYSQPWKMTDPEAEAQKERGKARRKAWWKRLHHQLIHNPLIPLFFRGIVWIFSLLALALGASIYHNYATQASTGNLPAERHASPEMAIIIDAVALVYIIYITYDEYMGKPLGLRSARAKMRLIFLDLFFIVFNSANLSLAFEAIADSLEDCGVTTDVCKAQRALSSVLLIVLITWMITFSISVLRVVERAVPR